MKTRQNRTINMTSDDIRSIIRLLERQNELLETMCRNVSKIVNADATKTRKSRRSDEQVRQLSLAMSTLQDDPLHNVLGAAKYAFMKMNGYKSLTALNNALSRQWNSRK